MLSFFAWCFAVRDQIEVQALRLVRSVVKSPYKPDQLGKQDSCYLNISQPHSSLFQFCQVALTTTSNGASQAQPLVWWSQMQQAVMSLLVQLSVVQQVCCATTSICVTKTHWKIGSGGTQSPRNVDHSSEVQLSRSLGTVCVRRAVVYAKTRLKRVGLNLLFIAENQLTAPTCGRPRKGRGPSCVAGSTRKLCASHGVARQSISDLNRLKHHRKIWGLTMSNPHFFKPKSTAHGSVLAA